MTEELDMELELELELGPGPGPNLQELNQLQIDQTTGLSAAQKVHGSFQKALRGGYLHLHSQAVLTHWWRQR